MRNDKVALNEDINSYVLNSARCYALKLTNKGIFPIYELDDLEQEILALFYYKIQKNKFDESKSSYKHWVSIIMESIYKDLVKKANSQKELASAKISLNEPICNDSDDNDELINFISCNGLSPLEEYEVKDMEMAIEKVISSLPDELKQLCRLLKTKNITEIAKELNLSRKTIYQRINKIKTLFEKEGLR